MFIPIGDETPRERTPYVNYFLLGANVLAFLAFCFPTPTKPFLDIYAMKPAQLDPKTLVTSMFLHAGIMHLLGNMVFLWIFGDNVEDRMGHSAYAGFYLAGAVFAGFAQALAAPASTVPMVGASGAIAAVMGAYFVLFPRARIVSLVIWGFWVDIIAIPAVTYLAIWFGMQLLSGTFALAAAASGGVAWWAHAGGFAFGAVVALGVRAGKRA